MTLQELQREIRRLSLDDQLALLESLIQAVRNRRKTKPSRREAINRLRGCLKSVRHNDRGDAADPKTLDFKAMRETRIQEKYLS